MHRLNRAEYSNAIRDLLAVDVKPGAWLPVDDSGYGFDNIAAVLSTSPALLERYMTAARRISRLAIGDVTLKPVEEIYDAKRDPVKGTRNERISDDLPFDSRAGISIQHYFPVDGEYVFKIRIPGAPIGENDAEIDPYQVRIPVKAGLHWVGVTSPRENLKVESEGPAAQRRRRPAGRGGGVPQIPYPVDLRLERRAREAVRRAGRNARRQAARHRRTLQRVRPRHHGEPREDFHVRSEERERRSRLRAGRFSTTLTRRAFRRPVKDADIQPLLAFYEKGAPPRAPTSTRAFSARSKRCSSLPISCSASSRIRRSTRRARPIRSAMSSWPRVCRSSSGAAFPTISCSTSPNAAG